MQPNNNNTNNKKKPRRTRRRKHSKHNNDNAPKSDNTQQNSSNEELSKSCCYVTDIPKSDNTQQINDMNIKSNKFKYFSENRTCPDVDLDVSCDFKHNWSTKQEVFSSVSNSSHCSSSNISFSSFIDSDRYKQQMETSVEQIESALGFCNRNNNVNTHDNLSKAELKDIYIREKKICFARRLPLNLCNESTLESNVWFGQFGYINQTKLNLDKQQAHIIYNNEHSAEQAIQFGKTKGLHVSFGTKRYCETFIETGKHCDKLYCTYAHKWCKPEDIVSVDAFYKKSNYCIKPSLGTDLMKRLENENEEWNSKYRNLKIDYKQLQIKYEVLNDKYKKLEDKFNDINNCINIDIYKYKTWDCEQVYQWIVWEGNYNGYFQKFATELFYNNLKNENIDGECLSMLTEGDIFRMGITDFKVKKLLIKHIQILISKTATTNDGSNGKEMDQIHS